MKEFGLIPHRSIHWPLVVMLPAFCPQIAPIMPVLPVMPTHKYCAVYNLRFDLFHGMEEVVGSIPTRSTIESKYLHVSPFPTGVIWCQRRRDVSRHADSPCAFYVQSRSIERPSSSVSRNIF